MVFHGKFDFRVNYPFKIECFYFKCNIYDENYNISIMRSTSSQRAMYEYTCVMAARSLYMEVSDRDSLSPLREGM